jgi:hypothetical protein
MVLLTEDSRMAVAVTVYKGTECLGKSLLLLPPDVM